MPYVLYLGLVVNAALVSACANCRDSSKFIVFLRLFCPLPVDNGTRIGNKTDFLGVFTGSYAPTSCVDFDTSGTGSKATGGCCTGSGRVL